MNIKESRWRWVIVALVFFIAIAVTVVSSLRPSSTVPLTNLNNVGELRDQFNRDSGKVRVVLLLSPT